MTLLIDGLLDIFSKLLFIRCEDHQWNRLASVATHGRFWVGLVQREMERSRLLLGTSDNAVRGAHRSCRKKSNKEGDIFLSDF